MAGRMRTFPEIWTENMRRGESEIYFTADRAERDERERERGGWSINLDVFIMGAPRILDIPTLFRM